MTPNRPYLIRALYEWILDNGMTPHLLVDTSRPETFVPVQFVRDGRIVLNISPSAVRDLTLGNDRIAFSARFGGTPMDVGLPVAAVLGLYARENGRGMLFPEEEPAAETEEDPDPDRPGGAGTPRKERPRLKVVK